MDLKFYLMFPYHCSLGYRNFKAMFYVDFKLWLIKVVKLDVCEWRVFAKPVTYTVHSFIAHILQFYNICVRTCMKVLKYFKSTNKSTCKTFV